MYSAHGAVRRLPAGTQGTGIRTGGLPRRAVIAGAVALATPFLPRFAHAAEITWRIAHNAPASFPLHVRLAEAATAIATRSEGQMAVELYPDNQLGIPVGLLAQLRAGTIDAVPLTSQVLTQDLPVAALPMLGFAFAGPDQVWPAMDGALGGFLRDQLSQRLGLVAMTNCWDFGFRQISTTSKPVNSAADLAGLRLRTAPEANFIGLFQALRALPVAMPLNSLTRALTSHTIDGQESVLGLMKAAALFRVQSLCALTNHVWDGPWLCVAGKSWSKLPAKLQDIVAAALNESARQQRQDTAAAEAGLRRELEASGMKFNPVDTRSFRTLLRKSGYYAAWHTKTGDDGWAALEKYSGSLD